MTPPEIADAFVFWNDRYGNSPDLIVNLRGPLEFPEPWMKVKIPDDDHSLYWRCDGPFYVYFVWAGKPDRGFGGWRRTIKLVNGTSEEVVGGWTSNPSSFKAAGMGEMLEVTAYQNGAKATSCALPREEVERIVEQFCPDVEIIETGKDCEPITFKLAGELSKEEWMELEGQRTDAIRAQLKEKYGTRWYDLSTAEEKQPFQSKPYSGIGGRTPQSFERSMVFSQRGLS